eukprot:g7690.t1
METAALRLLLTLEYASNDVAKSIANALSDAIAEADGNGDVDAGATAFAQAIAQAYARIISKSEIRVFVSGGTGRACGHTRSNAAASASAIARATSSAFAKSSNRYARAAADCSSEAVASVTRRFTQRLGFNACTTYGYSRIFARLVTIGYVQAIATAFSSVFTAIVNKDADAAADCVSSGFTSFGSTTFGSTTFGR